MLVASFPSIDELLI